MNYDTKEPVMVDGKAVTAEGTTEVVFTFDGRGLGGSTTVVFEEPEKPSPSVPVKTPITGDQSNVWAWRFATGSAMALMLGVVLWKRYKRK